MRKKFVILTACLLVAVSNVLAKSLVLTLPNGKRAYYLLGEEEEKKEQPTDFDGLSEKRKALMDFAMSVPEDKAELLLQVMRTILEND